MAAEFIAWRGCPLQRELGPDGFVARFKLRDAKQIADARVPDPEKRRRATVRVALPDGQVRDLKYTELEETTKILETGIADCTSCLLARDGQPVGCRKSVIHPIDADFERLAFDFFTTTVVTPDSTSFELWRDVVRYQAGQSPWHLRRGPEKASLADLPEPLKATVTLPDGEEAEFDSAMLLASLFMTAEGNAQVVAYHKWWTQLMNYSERPGVSLAGSRSWAQIVEIRRLYLRAFIFGMHQPVGLLIDSR